MSRHVLGLLALLSVTDAITVHGRVARPVAIIRPDAGDAARLSRQYGLL